MNYLAKWRLNNAGQIILPGCSFQAAFSEEQETRLLKLGAIEKADKDVFGKALDVASGLVLDELWDTADDSDAGVKALATTMDEAPEEAPLNAEEDTQAADAEDEYETEDDTQAPIIDVMDGVVEATDPPDDAPSDTKKSGRKRRK